MTRTNQRYYSQGGNGQYDKSVTLHYVELPLVYKRSLYRIKDSNGEYSFHFGVGFSTAFRTYASIKWAVEDKEQSMYDFLTQSRNDNTERLSELISGQGDPDYNEVFQNFDIAGLGTLGVLYKPSLRWMF